MAGFERLEELYKYFRSAQDIVDIDIDNDAEYEPRHARLSHDPVLNALAQLGVCRLGCERAFVSLIDNRNQYVVAEVSKSVSLYNADHHPGDGGLAIGVRALDLVSGVCAGTMPAFTDRKGAFHISTTNITANSKSFVIKDFTLEAEYLARPYVVAFPFMRFYAGVPIRSNSGHVIGTYAVIDNQPREGLDDQGFLVLTEIASSIMRHLELLKIQTSHDDVLRLLGGLKSFVEGSNTNTAVAKPDVQKLSLPDQIQHSDRLESPIADQEHSNGTRHESTTNSTGNEHHAGDDNAPSQMISHKLDVPISQLNVKFNTSRAVKAPPIKAVKTAHASPIDQHDSPRDIELLGSASQYDSLLARAAESIQAAMRMDEVFLVDTPPSTASFVESSIFVKANASFMAKGSARPISVDQEDTASPSGLSNDQTSWHRSEANSHTSLGGPVHLTFSDEYCISEELHNELLSQFPGGCFFNFTDREAENHRAIASSKVYTGPDSTNCKQLTMVPEVIDQNHQKRLDKVLQAAFPLAKSMMFLPLFGLENSDCPFSIVTWSSESRRIIQQEDFSYLGLFGVAIQAEFARIITAIQNRAKSDFISSISHELRSPLHGILGNAELLLDSNVEQEQRQMAEMIEKCGRSLLSTMDHILTYSKINSTTQDGRLPNYGVGNESVSDSIDLSAVIEDSVDTLVAGNHFRAPSGKSNSSEESKSHLMSYQRSAESTDAQQGPMINLTIDYCPSWYVVTDTPVWARCVMNVLGNALKYTDSGIIEVRLQLAPPSDGGLGEHIQVAKLLVSDTGRGISPDYLRSHLYQPFLQENASSNGLGLGLSIVKKLIDGLNGSIQVQSTMGKGTMVEILVPLKVESPTGKEGTVNAKYSGRKICFVGTTQRRWKPDTHSQLPSRGNGGAALSSALSMYCRQWFDMEVSRAATLDHATADVVVLFAEDLETLQNGKTNGEDKDNQRRRCSLLIVPTIPAATHSPNLAKIDGVFYLLPPFGPRRLAATLEKALDYTDKVKDGTMASGDSGITLNTATRTRHREAEPDRNDVMANSRKPSNKEHQSEAQGHAMTLIVDDNEVNVKLLEKCLKRWGIAYKTASNGVQAIEVFQNSGQAFNYILMDISMPVMNGIEATRAIRNLEAAQSTRPPARIIAMTGLGNERTRQEALASGMDVFLTKPVRLREVRTFLQVS